MSRRLFELRNTKPQESHLVGGSVGHQSGSIAKLRGDILDLEMSVDSTGSEDSQYFKDLFLPIQQKIESDKTLTKIDFENSNASFNELTHEELKYFYYEIMLRNPNIILFDKDTRVAIKNSVGQVAENEDDKMRLDVVTMIGGKLLENKNSAEALSSNIIDIFNEYRNTNLDIEIEVEEMQRCLRQLPAIIRILERGSKSVIVDLQVLGEFKNFCKNFFSNQEQEELAHEGKSEFEIMEAGLKERIERKKNPSADVQSPDAMQTAPASPESAQSV